MVCGVFSSYVSQRDIEQQLQPSSQELRRKAAELTTIEEREQQQIQEMVRLINNIFLDIIIIIPLSLCRERLSGESSS